MNLINFKSQNPGNNYFENTKENKLRKRKRRFLFWLLIILVIFGLVFFTAFALTFKFYSTSKKVIIDNPPQSFFESLKDVSFGKNSPLRADLEGRTNILLLGLAGENYPGENLTDSIIIASVNSKTYQTALLSIPRDLYVQIPGTKYWTKINALYARGKDRRGKTADGIEDLKKALSEITGLDIHYYIALDFDGFKQIIDELGGIKIQVFKDIHDERYPGPNYSYDTFDIKKGLYTFNGETALKYARTRHDKEGDFGRAHRQQQILESVRQKAFSVGTLLNVPALIRIFDVLGNHLRTDVPLDQINSFIDIAKNINPYINTNKVLEAGKTESLLAVSHIVLGGVRAFILIPRTGKYDEIQELAKNIFDLELLERKKKEIDSEKATVAIVNRSGTSGLDKKIVNLLRKLGYNAKTASFKTAKSLQLENAAKSTIYDVSKTKPFSLEDLTKKFSADIFNDLPENLSAPCQDVDLCLIAGADLVDNLNYEEGTIEELEEGYDKQTIDEKTYIDLLKKGNEIKF